MVTAVVVIVALVLVLLVGLLLVRRRRREALVEQRRAELRERFGPEYERYLAGSPNRSKAERRLMALVDRRDRLDIRDLTGPERERLLARWAGAQARFVDEPPQAVDDAEALITEVMKERGYPTDDFGTRADMIMVDHAEIVQHFRSAHESHERHRASGQLDTEDLRQAFMHYRTLFRALSGPTGPATGPAAATRPMPSGRHASERPQGVPATGAPQSAATPPVGPPSATPVGPQEDTRPVPAARSAVAGRRQDEDRPPVTPSRSGPVVTGRVLDRDEPVAAGAATDPRRPQEIR